MISARVTYDGGHFSRRYNWHCMCDEGYTRGSFFHYPNGGDGHPEIGKDEGVWRCLPISRDMKDVKWSQPEPGSQRHTVDVETSHLTYDLGEGYL